MIEKNLMLNQCKNAIVRAFALGDAHKRIPLPASDGGNTVLARSGQEVDETEIIEVESVRLDDEISKDTRVDFIKIDVEGSDLKMMRERSEC